MLGELKEVQGALIGKIRVGIIANTKTVIDSTSQILYHIYRKCSRSSRPEQQLVFDHLDSLVSAPLVHILLGHILKKVQQIYFFIQSIAFLLCYAITLRNGSAEQRNTTRHFGKTFTLYGKKAKTHSRLITKHKTPSWLYLLKLRHRQPWAFRWKRIL